MRAGPEPVEEVPLPQVHPRRAGDPAPAWHARLVPTSRIDGGDRVGQEGGIDAEPLAGIAAGIHGTPLIALPAVVHGGDAGVGQEWPLALVRDLHGGAGEQKRSLGRPAVAEVTHGAAPKDLW
jgi:hypothetical protein